MYKIVFTWETSKWKGTEQLYLYIKIQLLYSHLVCSIHYCNDIAHCIRYTFLFIENIATFSWTHIPHPLNISHSTFWSVTYRAPDVGFAPGASLWTPAKRGYVRTHWSVIMWGRLHVITVLNMRWHVYLSSSTVICNGMYIYPVALSYAMACISIQ